MFGQFAALESVCVNTMSGWNDNSNGLREATFLPTNLGRVTGRYSPLRSGGRSETVLLLRG